MLQSQDLLGIDLGNWSCYVKHGWSFPVDFDLPIKSYQSCHVKTQISQIKCLLGRKFSDPELQLELDYIPFRVIDGPNGCPLVHGRCNGEDRAFTPVEILAMLISTPEFLAEEENSDSSPFACIGIPIYFTDQQKKDVLEAAKKAGFSPEYFRLLDETTATVMALERHVSHKRDIVAFVDIGHASMQVFFAKFKRYNGHRGCDIKWITSAKTSVNILYKGYARSLGGREFDKVLFKHFASKIRKEYNIDVSENSSACVRLNEACESLKKKLSKSNEASFCIKKFSGSIDVKGSITRKEFERLSISILKKIEVVLKKALGESRLNVEQIDCIEAVGKGSSIPAIIDILTETFGKKPLELRDYEINPVAKGCATRTFEPIYLPAAPKVSNENRARENHPIKAVFYMNVAMGIVQETQLTIHHVTGTDKRKNNLITGLETSELVSSELNSEEEKAEDSEMLLTFLNDFFEKNMHRIKRSEKTKDESYWLISDGKYFGEYSYSELQDATNNFHESYKLGEGGFGIVYKGILPNTTVAIKILKEGSSQGAKEFNQEVEILSKVRHPHLVKLIGACAETRALIYEYLPNGSLEDRLRCKNNTSPLSWQARVRIAFEICTALCFLHCVEPHGIVHGDLKPDNILLDGNNTSKICDFGLCRQLNWTASASIPYHWTDCPKGTFAYMDPEYFSTGKITPQFDVYSFGILLLRIATCKSPMGIRQLMEEAQKKGRLKALIDASAGAWPFKEAKKMISLGLRCSDPLRKNRPDMSTKVWKELKSMAEVASASVSL